MTQTSRRAYQSPRREEQAAQTRADVLRAAHELFIKQGYVATTLEQIAERAGVSRPTVFTSVGNKQQVFKVVRDVAMAGDDAPVRVAERGSFQRARDAADQGSALQAFCSHIVTVNARYAELDQALRGAAAAGDPQLRELAVTSDQQRHRGAQLIVKVLRSKGPLRPGLSSTAAADVLDHYMDPQTYVSFVLTRGWTEKRYVAWMHRALSAELFGGSQG